MQACIEELGHLPPPVLAGKIGPPDLAGKECVAGKDHQRVVGDGPVAEEKRYALRRVAGRLQDLDLERPDPEGLPFPNSGAEPERLPRPVEDLRPGRAGELPGAADIILVFVRLKDLCDLHVLAPGGARVDPAVASRIDDRRLPARPDDVGVVSKDLGLNLLKQHRHSSPGEQVPLPVPIRPGCG